MKIFDLAKKLRVSEYYIHRIIRDLDTKDGIKFTKKGNEYDLTLEEVKLILKEIMRRKGLE